MCTQMSLDWGFAEASARGNNGREHEKARAAKPRLTFARCSLILLYAVGKCLEFVIMGWARPLVAPMNRLERRFDRVFRFGSRMMNLSVVLLVLFSVVACGFNVLNRIRTESGYSWATQFDIVLSAFIAPNVAKPMSAFQRKLAYWYVGLTPQEQAFFDQVAKCESAYKPNAVGVNRDAAGNVISYDEGLLQINSWWGTTAVYDNGKHRGEAFAVISNLRIAAHILRTEGPDEWVCARKLGLTEIALN